MNKTTSNILDFFGVITEVSEEDLIKSALKTGCEVVLNVLDDGMLFERITHLIDIEMGKYKDRGKYYWVNWMTTKHSIDKLHWEIELQVNTQEYVGSLIDCRYTVSCMINFASTPISISEVELKSRNYVNNR